METSRQVPRGPLRIGREDVLRSWCGDAQFRTDTGSNAAPPLAFPPACSTRSLHCFGPSRWITTIMFGFTVLVDRVQWVIDRLAFGDRCNEMFVRRVNAEL